MKQKDFICTRPLLARRLIDAAQEPHEIVNPWDPKRNAWLFEITPQLVRIVTEFYREIGKPLPGILRATEKGGPAA